MICGMEKKCQKWIPSRDALFALLVGLNVNGIMAVSLFSRVLLDYLGETAIPTVISEVFWICIWLVMAELAMLIVMSAIAHFRGRRI